MGVLKFLAYHGLIKNKVKCENCQNLMGLNKKDDFGWKCKACVRRKSVRDKSFEKSLLSISKLLALIYMWIEDFCNKNVIKESKPITSHTVVNWFNYCRKEY